MIHSNQFVLERYRSGGANRYTCPFCGQKKCFTRYINVDTGEYVHETCGKCNHENSCPTVHYPPREYFRDHPEAERHDTRSGFLGANAGKGRQTYVLPAPTQTEFFPHEWAEEACQRQSTFRKWFESLPFEGERIRQVLSEYLVGATERYTVVEGVNVGPAAVFWMIDEQQRVHDAKLIAYTADGHRVQGWGNSMRAICEKAKRGPQLLQTEKVLFGLHLLPRYPDKTVFIVESEKSALVCACRYPQHLWLATGGCGNLQGAKLRPLTERRIVVVPDSGAYDKWSERMKQSGHRHYHVVDFLEQYEPNTDIADIILGQAKKK